MRLPLPLAPLVTPLVVLAGVSPARAADWNADSDAPRTEASHAANLEPMPARRGLQLAARLAYTLPNGQLSNDPALSTSLSHLETATVPIGLDAGYRLSPVVYLGGTLVWAPGVAPHSSGTCPANDSCFRQDAQLRAEARFYFAPQQKVSWWGSVGSGWEVATFSQSAGSEGATATLTGPVFADLELGFDVRRGALGIGPYFGLSLGEFLTHGQSPSEAPVATWIDHPSLHAGFTLGVRGAYGPW